MPEKHSLKHSQDTISVHAGEPNPRIEGAVTLPIFQSSTYLTTEASSYEQIRYLRLSNSPNHIALAEKLAALENAEAALVTASGMAAISTSLLAHLNAGDHLLAQQNLYGATHHLISNDLVACGITVDFFDATKPEDLLGKLNKKTKVIYLESLSNPLIGIADIPAIVAIAQRQKILTFIDNTFASPVNLCPMDLGIDLSLHSATKYLNGHSDIVAGAVIGKKVLLDKILQKLNTLGGSLDPHSCFLLQRGIKTLGLRVQRQNQNAQKIAEYLAKHNKISKVHYPGLSSHPQHALAKKIFSAFGGVLSFELQNNIDPDIFIKKLKLAIYAPSLGGVETLITRPCLTTHLGVGETIRLQMGITDQLIRIAVGIEHSDDLIKDLAQALDAC